MNFSTDVRSEVDDFGILKEVWEARIGILAVVVVVKEFERSVSCNKSVMGSELWSYIIATDFFVASHVGRYFGYLAGGCLPVPCNSAS